MVNQLSNTTEDPAPCVTCVSPVCVFYVLWQFTWCLDACIREKFVDGKRARELQGFLDGVKKGQEQVLG